MKLVASEGFLVDFLVCGGKMRFDAPRNVAHICVAYRHVLHGVFNWLQHVDSSMRTS